MVLSIQHPELLTITDEVSGERHFGGFQEWYALEWNRLSGCGPTCAANVLSYLALTRPELRPLYPYETMDIGDFTRFMEDVFPFVKPGKMGLNRVEMFSDGITGFAQNRGIALKPQVFRVSGCRSGNREGTAELAEFVRAGLKADCPLGFLNLSRGKEKTLQNWHWITVTAADMEEEKLIACASDEGKEIRFDLKLWFLTTRMSGGLVYFETD